ncbi:hypothetical protein [Mangrovibacterium diazotrophicum]|uniref:Uncharacterized protein n=1 Tax=Mangrovibacterium diazotrophicum TaxID=1261403 RepID=A0A419W565_9BACT|nr:hypothetical protein [Mangrovibacterium diazotrophicum]RKD90602.1 hypothetical protein BC643_0942 [Mangrovibacterium diazotrophicum]
MEYKELEQLWRKYDNKLDTLESLNKKLILETLAQKSQKKIDWLQYRNYYGLVIGPIVLAFVFHEQFRPENFDLTVLLGTLLWIVFFVYSSWFFISAIRKLKSIDIVNDTVLGSTAKLNDYKKMFVRSYQLNFLWSPVALAGTLLIGWNMFHFDFKTILFIVLLAVFMLLLSRRNLMAFLKKSDRILEDIEDLGEYKE